MRCLYCNKKLSLLKLAKGDSFCSPEHFDAHQLKLSKDGFERLMQVTAEEPAKAPLVVALQEEATGSTHDSGEESAAFARLSAFAPPPLEAVSKEVAPKEIASSDPPYARFANSPLPPVCLDVPFPVSNGPEAEQAGESVRELAFPVHEKHGTVCILNLYVQLTLAETEPLDWKSEDHLVVAPEDFRPEINQPKLAFSPELPQIEELAISPKFPQVENLAPSPELSQMENLELSPGFPQSVIPQVENLAPAEPSRHFAAAVPVVDAAPLVEALPPSESAPSVKPVMPVGQATPVDHAIPVETETRVTFSVAPSFRARMGTPIVLKNTADAIPNRAALAPVLENGRSQRLDSCDTIPKSTRFAQNTALRSQDSTAHWIYGAPELPAQLASVLPEGKGLGRKEAWSQSDARIAVDLKVLESSQESTRPVDFDLPVPASLIVRPDAMRPSGSDPQQLLAGTSPLDTGSVLRSVLETRPMEQEAVFVDPPASALKYVWHATLAPFPGQEPLDAAWQLRTSYFSLPDPIATGSQSPMSSVNSLPYAPACIKVDRIEEAKLPAPYLAKDVYRLAPWPQTDSAFTPIIADSDLVFSGSTMLPQVAAVPPGGLKTGSGAPYVNWELRSPVSPAPLLVKLLPIRDSAILPAARKWQRLEPVPR